MMTESTIPKEFKIISLVFSVAVTVSATIVYRYIFKHT